MSVQGEIILEVLRSADHPMTVAEITGARPGELVRNTVEKQVKSLERYNLIEKVPLRTEWGSPVAGWRAVR